MSKREGSSSTMIKPSSTQTLTAQAASPSDWRPTLWGFSPVELHDRYWAARGIQVIRPGESVDIAPEAELFLLTDLNTLASFKLGRLADKLSWVKPDLLWVRLHYSLQHGYKEIAKTDPTGQFLRFERKYDGLDHHVTRCVLTPNPDLALLWQCAPGAEDGWRKLRQTVPQAHRHATALNGDVYQRNEDEDLVRFIRDLMKRWKRPDATIQRIHKLRDGVWADRDAEVAAETQFVGAAWIGAGRTLDSQAHVLGPAVLWDCPDSKPPIDDLSWEAIERTQAPSKSLRVPLRWRRLSSFDRAAKRCFDVLFSLAAITLTLPLYPLVMLAILIEDGWPIFFVHHRETMGGREFPCIKFRSMRKDSETIKAKLAEHNQADGPQFFIDDDPRLTRIGKLIRKLQIDELPQFFNVLVGHMSIVGPRPSPRKENQYCPPWREARLSVRPGVTGLWQVSRTREAGRDFQEWIRYDIEYVERANFWLDMEIIFKTIRLILRFGK